MSEVSLGGRIAVRAAGTALDERALPGRQPRLAFSLLLLERHRVVPRDELAENLWVARRPETWETAIRGVVSRVRGFVVASGLGGRDALRTYLGAYRMELADPVAVDVEIATAALRRAERALEAGDPRLAAVEAARARGVLVRPFLPGIEAPWVEDRRRELHLCLLRSLELLAEARILLGEHGYAARAAADAIALDQLRESAHRSLVRALAGSGNGAAAVQAYERCRRLLAEELGVDPSQETQRLQQELLQGIPTTPARAGGDAGTATLSRPRPVAPATVPPYLGLRTFDEEHAAWFFGRSADVARCLDALTPHRFLAVLGPSGSGKSSLVRAGLVPALRHGALPGSDTWAVRVFRPGPRPTEALARELAALDPRAAGVAEPLKGPPAALHDRIERTHREGLAAERILLVIDQLEEVFTSCPDEDERTTFLELLATAAAIAGGRTVVVATLRADFYPRLAEHPAFGDLAAAHQILVADMDEVGLAEAIEEPAKVAGLVLEPGLTSTILRDVARRPGALPLLSHALFELWRRRVGSALTLASYLSSGGVEGAVAQRGEETYLALPAEQRTMARRVLLRLTQPGDGTPDTRRRVPRSELAPGADGDQVVDHAVEAFAAARLVTIGTVGPADEPHVELSHEALLRSWPRLRGWIDENRAGLLVHRRVTAAAEEWQRLGRDAGALYRGAHLAEALAWAERDPEACNPLEREFLGASRASEADDRRRRVRRLRWTAATLGVGLVALAALSLVATSQASRLAEQVRVSTARELAAAAVNSLDTDPERSILLALESVDRVTGSSSVPPEVEEALHRAVRSSRVVRRVPQGGHGLAVDPSGDRFVTGGRDGTAIVWDLETGERLLILEGHAAAVMATAVSPDGSLIATAGAEGTVRLWDATTGEQQRVLEGHDGEVSGVAFSPDGTELATAGVDASVRTWDTATGEQTRSLEGHEEWIFGVSYSPDGRRLVSTSEMGGGPTTIVWDLDASERAYDFSHGNWGVVEGAFSPDGTLLVTASGDSTARVWDAETGAPGLNFSRHVGNVFSVDVSPDGRRVVSGGSDATARVWEIATGRELMVLSGHGAAVHRVRFTPDGRHVLTGGGDGTTRVWDVTVGGARDHVTVPAAASITTTVAFSPDGTMFASPREPSGVTLWDTATGDEVRTLAGPEIKLANLAFSPDGRRLAAASDLIDVIPVWDVASGELERTLTGHEKTVHAVSFARDGRLLSAGWDGTARIWDVTTGEEVGRLDHPGKFTLVAIASPDGADIVTGDEEGKVTIRDAATLEIRREIDAHDDALTAATFGPGQLLLTASDDGTVRGWDRQTGEQLLGLGGEDAPFEDVAVSPDETLIAAAASDGTVKLWDLETGRRRLTLHGHTLKATGVDFSPDGRLIASASPDGTAALHLLRLDELVEVARNRLTRTLTDAECAEYLRVTPCP
ncbi:BTAD domain-containing putative transcriptional regulator [Nitriliruptor alkaliphilus]|uniref:nSTAND1 domain-containing NTPase n=1 Tax=Nitriliruptor alkaliphilus TaxID=427918 RepID=UPI0006974343|nr:BTAD domain-containing putative transcriptional regulator [Nitriliruptor alkaliphilus]